MYYILTVLLLAFGIYTLAGNFIDFPTKRTEKAMSAFRRKQGIGERFYTAVTYPLTKIISKFIRMENYQKRKLEKNLARAGINLSPAEYYAKAYVTAGLVILSSAAREKLKKINGKILDELPRFVRTYNNSLKSSKDILKFMERYRKIAGDDFKYDLDILITDLKTGNTEEALQRFDERTGYENISKRKHQA